MTARTRHGGPRPGPPTEPVAYPPTAPASATVPELRRRHGALGPDERTDEEVSLVGRAVLVRDHGGIAFVVVQQGGDRIQAVVETRTGSVPERGDVVGVSGVVGTTRTGELSVFADELVVLAPTLLPPPDKRHGPREPGRRARERELDLFSNPASRRTFELRSAVVHALRTELHDLGFTEVETPVFATSAGGAVARPFTTHHHALGIDLYLRIAPELHLKRLVVGGFDRVFEIGRVFRNEGIDSTHNPEFTILEAYQAPADYVDMMGLVERLVVAAARASGSTVVELDGRPVDLGAPWRRVRMLDVVEEVTGRRIDPAGDLDAAREALDSLDVAWEDGWGPGRCLVAAFEDRVERTLLEPTIVFDHPVETSPLARRHRSDPGVAERFEVFVGGRELANAYSELNDPADQRSRMQAAAAAVCGPDERGTVPDVDEDFLRALERGMPPTGGLGIGIDRLVMLLAGASSIRDVILFPTQRPERGRTSATAGAPVLPTTPLPTTVRPGAPVSVVRLSGLVRVVATLTTVVGVLTMLSALPALAVRVVPIDELVSPLPQAVDDRVLAVGLGLCMVLLAGQLLRGKRRAWKLAVGLFALSALLSVVRGGELVALVTSASMLVVLGLTRRDFTGLRDPPSITQVVLAAPRYLLFVYTYGFLALWSQRNRLEPPFGWVRSAEAITLGLFGASGPYTYQGSFATWFPASLVVLGVLGLLLLLWLLLRPAVAAAGGTVDGRARAEALVDEWGWDTLAPFALRGDRSWFFSSDGRAMIAYGYLGGFALGSGDPIGDPASVPLVVDEFIEHCRHHGWQPAFLAAREIDVPFYAERGFRDFYLGDEAVLDCRRFDLDGPGMGPVRQSVRRVEGSHRFELVSEAAAGPELAAQLNEISVRWRAGEDERGYTMAMSQDVGATDPDRLLAVAWARPDAGDGPEVPVAFLRLIPVGRADGDYGRGYTLDLMRRVPEAANGIVEYLVARTVEELDDRGVRRLSLNFAAFSRLLDDEVQHTRVDRFLRRVVDVLNPYYQIRSLREFNEKFQPEWQPRSLVYADPGDLPKVGLRYAFLEGFVDVPLVGRLLSGPTEATSPAPARTARGSEA
ncbi:lysine--tRNA ligase [Dermatobacter hominis]|uniref:lysine--tRNA ligase n=1 Tax=Dermatobacter hominis TaxID=2884263 RepID=UPI001D12C6D9|nr:lysine--tRNA ligase [Dermatobacter hominis]UDY35407.1 lysine--tRNA ligase [Dermatobacter hominis]